MGDEPAYWSEAETAKHLRSGRTYLDLSQEELAARLGVSAATVNRHEQGKNLPTDPFGRAKLLEDLWMLGCPRGVLGLPEDFSLASANAGDLEQMRAALEAVSKVERERRSRSDGEPRRK